MLATKNRAVKEPGAGSRGQGSASRRPSSVRASWGVLLTFAILMAGCTPPGPRALLEGRRLLDEGKYVQAVEKLKVATSLLATNASAWNYLGLAYHRASQPSNAAVAYQRALSLNRDLLEARFNLGCLWLEQNNLDAARSEFTAYTLRRGGEVEGWLKLGTVQLRARDSNAAEKSFREALRVNRQNVEALNGLGLAQLQRNRPREAVQFFADALKQQADYRPALLNLASVLHQHLNDRAGALQKYREYLALQPQPADWEAVNALAKSLEPPLVTPPRPPATNVVTHLVANTNAIKATSAPVARATAPAKIEPTPVVPKPSPAPPPADTTPVEVVRLPPEFVVKPAVDVPAARPLQTNERAVVEPTPPAPSTHIPVEPAKPAKPGFLTRVNPLNLFRRDSKPSSGQTPLASSNKAVASSPASNPDTEGDASVPNPSSAAEPPGSGQVAAASRYAYLSPAKPTTGNRREAERAFGEGQQAQRANRLTAAVASYRQATALDGSYFEAHYNLALASYEARSYQQALAAWESALAIKPESNDARFNFALALKSANHPIDAANELEKVLAANPKEARGHLVLGNLYVEQLRDPARARTHYLKVLELEPRHPQATAIRYWLVANPDP